MEGFTVDIQLDIQPDCLENGEDLIFMPKLSEWFTHHQIVPSVGDSLFVSENAKKYPTEAAWTKSGEWIVKSKFYDHEHNRILIWCVDSRQGE